MPGPVGVDENDRRRVAQAHKRITSIAIPTLGQQTVPPMERLRARTSTASRCESGNRPMTRRVTCATMVSHKNSPRKPPTRRDSAPGGVWTLRPRRSHCFRRTSHGPRTGRTSHRTFGGGRVVRVGRAIEWKVKQGKERGQYTSRISSRSVPAHSRGTRPAQHLFVDLCERKGTKPIGTEAFLRANQRAEKGCRVFRDCFGGAGGGGAHYPRALLTYAWSLLLASRGRTTTAQNAVFWQAVGSTTSTTHHVGIPDSAIRTDEITYFARRSAEQCFIPVFSLCDRLLNAV